MESFDMFLSGNFVALPAFQRRYGVQVEGSGWTIPTRWQSALFQSGQCGAFIGVFLAGPITNLLGYRWTTMLALILMNATIFISFFVSGPRLVSVLLLSLSPDYIYLGRLTDRSYGWTSAGRRSLGTLHCKLPRLRQ
jgi:MFS family permease